MSAQRDFIAKKLYIVLMNVNSVWVRVRFVGRRAGVGRRFGVRLRVVKCRLCMTFMAYMPKQQCWLKNVFVFVSLRCFLHSCCWLCFYQC